MRAVGDRLLDADLWVCHSLGGAGLRDRVWLARLRGLTLAAGALTLAASGVKPIGPLAISDLLLAVAVALMLPRLRLPNLRRLWVPLLAVSLIALGAVIGTAVVSPSEASESGEMLVRFAVASAGAILLVLCWRPDLEQVRSFGWLWVLGGVAAATVALADGSPRPAGLTPHSTHLAIISLVLVGVSLGLASSERSWGLRAIAVAAAGVLVATIIVTGSRAALAAALIVILLALIATRNRIAVGFAVAVILAGVGLGVLNAVGEAPEWTSGSSRGNAIQRLFQERAFLGNERQELRDAAWDDFTSHPLTGVGFADATRPHNFALQMASSAGVLGVIGAFAIVALAIWAYARAVRRLRSSPAHWAMAAGLAAAVIGYLAANSFQNVSWDRSVWIAIALTSWMTVVVASRSGPGIGEDLPVEDPVPVLPPDRPGERAEPEPQPVPATMG